MKRKKPGIFRVLSLLLALLIVVNLPISAFAADATQESDIAALATDVPDEMLNSAIFRSLLYLGYDSDNYLRSTNRLFKPGYYGSSLEDNHPAALTGIPYANGGGRTEKAATTAQEKADTKTGRVPNISAFQTNGMVCTSFIEYYYLNYLKNIEGEIEKAQIILNAYVEALELCNNNSSKYPDAWSTTGNLLVSDKYNRYAKKTELDLEYAMDATSDEFAKFFNGLEIGALVQFGGDDPSYWLNDYIHYAVYAGCFNGEYFIIHVANNRGPEITLAKNMAKSNNKKSYPIAAYEFDPFEQYGSVDVFKADPDGKPLANAVFTLVNNDTGEEYTLITDSTGKAAQAGLYIDNEYTLTEVAAPPGYEIAEEHEWKFKLTAEKPTFSVSVTNTPKTGSLKIIKNILPSSAATSGNLIGWQFNIYKNSPTFTTTIRDGVIYRVKVTDKNGNSIYSDPSKLMVEEKETVEEPPIIITAQPSNAVVADGSDNVFTATAKSTTGKTLTYQWYYKNYSATSWSKASSGTSATYTVGMNSGRDGRGAKCLISDGTNEIWTEPAYMYLPGSLGVNKNPNNITAAYGTNASFTGIFYGTPTGYKWQYSADGTTWQDCSSTMPAACSGYNTATLRVTSDQNINGYQFRCVVTDGSKTFETLGGTLTAVPVNISFVSPSGTALVEIGETQSFYVSASGLNMTYQWQIWTPETNEWTDLEGKVNNGINLTMTEEYRSSRVRAKVMTGDVVLYSDPITFATPDSLYFTQNLTNISGTDGETVTLSVATSVEGLVYQWEMFDAATDKWISVDQQVGGTHTTNSQGTIQVNNLPVGDYYVVEIDTGREGWSYDLTPKAVTITENNTAEVPYEVTITNEALYGNVYIEKYTGDDNNIAGWKFYLYADAECSILVAGPKEINEDGYCLFEDLAPGTYWVREEGHRDPEIEKLYYCASENPQRVDVAAGKQEYVMFENELFGTIEIIKKGNNQELLSGATFKATDRNGDEYTFTESKENPGHYFLTNIPFGTYIVTEVTPPPGYEIGEQDTWTVTLSYSSINAKETITIINDEILGDLSIKKETEDGKNLEGWIFNVYADADCSVLLAGNLKTNDKGFITVPGLKPGTVWVREEGHVDTDIADLYYCNSTNPQSAEIKGHETATVTFENKLNRGEIEIIKKGNNDKLLSGAVFEAKDKDGNVYTFAESVEMPGHYFLNNVPYGKYIITEITPPEGYEIGDTNTWEVTLGKNSPNSKETLTVINIEILGDLLIQKETEDGKNLEGWIFNVYADADCSVLLAGNLKTNDKGFITVPGLKPGTVWVREEGHVDTDIADLYYCNSTNPQSAEIVGHKTATVTFENKLNRGSIEIIKKDENDKLLTGAEFKAVDANGNIFYFVEDADRPGYYYLNNVPYGTYTVTETKYPNGYEAGSETEWVVELGKNSPNGSESITIVNKLKIGTLTVIKVDQFGNPVAGAVFVATAEDGTTYEFPATDEKGSATITVPFGKYTITEKIMPDGYEAGEITEWPAELDDNTPNRAVTVTAVNNKIVGSITVHKLDENGNLLAGAKFQATHLNTGTVYDFIEVSPGVFELHNLPMGRYQIIETQYPEEYCSPAMQLIMVHLEEEISKRHQTVEVVNIPKQYTIVVLKVDENGNPLANAGFVAVAEDGTRYPFPLTDQYGEAKITVPKGTYTITELLFPEGYQAGDVKEWTVTVSEKISMKPYTITAVNKEILGSIEIVKTDEHGNLLSGAGFIAMGKDATYPFVEVEAGRYRVDNLPLGFYLVEEIQWPDGYEGNEGAAFPVELSTKSPNYTESNYTEILEIVNKQKVGKLEIQKITNTGMNKDGWKVNVYRGSVSPENLIPGSPFTTKDGKIVIENLPIGVYIAVEVDDGKELWIYDLEEKVTEVRHNDVGYITIRNTHLGYGQIKKEMPDGGSVAGWIFDVYRISDNAYVGYFTTDENGDATIGELLPGDYRVVERVPEGSLYLPVGGNEKILTVVAGEISTLTVRNVLQSGEIILNKLDSSDDKALAGAKFLLEWLDGDVWKPVILSDTVIPGGCRSEGLVNGCLVTGSNGQIIFEGLHPDLEYRLTEVEAPDGYTLQSAPVFEGKLPADTLSKEVTAYNSGIFDVPETGDNSYLNVLIPFVAIVVCVFLTMVALAIKEGMLTEMIRKYKK